MREDTALNGGSAPVPLAIGGLLSLAVALGIGRFVYTPILPVMAEALRLTVSQTGLVASANFAGYLAGALAAATPWLTGSRRLWLLGSLAVSAATTALMGLTDALPVFLLSRFVGGVASALVMVFASALVLERLAAARRGDLSALHFAGVGVGIVASAALVSGALALGVDWRGLWLICGLCGAFAALAVARLVPDRPEPARAPAASGPAGERRPARGLAAFVLAYGLFGFGYVVTATFLVAIVRGAPETRALEAWVWIVVGLTAAPSVALWTGLAGRLGVARAFALACLVEAAGVAASVAAASGLAVLLAAACLGGTFMGITALGLVGARTLAGTDARRTLAMMSAAFGAGQIVGPLFAGYLHDLTGSFAAPSLAAAGALVIAAALSTALPARLG